MNENPEPGADRWNQGADLQKQFEQAIGTAAKAIEEGDDAKAQQSGFEALMLAAQRAAENPTPELLLQQKADDLEEAGDWAAAEQAHRNLIVLQQKSGNDGMVANAHLRLSRHLRLLGRLDEAREEAVAASTLARRFGVCNFTTRILENEVCCALERSDTSRALQVATEAVDLLPEGRLYDSSRVKALITRAEARVAAGDLAGAEADLAASGKLIKGTGLGSMLPGPISRWASWYEVRSLIRVKKQRLSRAAEDLAKAVQYARQLLQGNASPYTHLKLARLLERTALLADGRGKAEEAKAARTEVHALRSRAHLPLAL